MAVVLAIYGVGTTLGPFIGGEIVETTSWRWVFYINLPIGGAALVVLYLALHVKYNKEMTLAKKIKRIDSVGNLLLIASTVSTLYALATAGTKYGWGSWQILVPLILGLFGFGLFIAFEQWGFSAEPVMPPQLFATRTSIIVSINTFLNSALLYWVIYFLPVYFQAVRLYDPAYTGVALIPQSLVGIPGAAISAVALSRWGRYKPLHFVGFAIFALGLGLFSLLNENSTKAYWATFESIMALGAGVVLNTQLPAFQAPIAEEDQAAATAAWCFVRTFGNVWGIAIPAVIFNNRVSTLAERVSDSEIRKFLRDGHAYQYGTADFVGKLSQPLKSEVISVYRDSLHLVFQVAVAFAGLAAFLALLEKEYKLREELDTEFGLKGPEPKNAESGDSLSREEAKPRVFVEPSEKGLEDSERHDDQ
ncbi:hypothetical protein ONZ43_g5763 [Nemania bipapillata]|uniref:Uncharacterized protein n=1 Tax=Nemania bipapillata TaxID=110536 RepID=A0ACC2I6S4_9PEZI|nr:hypothetical protein ONZ43_g5763 [Nemania bipapillata]